jgi:hypothetical protein
MCTQRQTPWGYEQRAGAFVVPSMPQYWFFGTSDHVAGQSTLAGNALMQRGSSIGPLQSSMRGGGALLTRWGVSLRAGSTLDDGAGAPDATSTEPAGAAEAASTSRVGSDRAEVEVDGDEEGAGKVEDDGDGAAGSVTATGGDEPHHA